MSLEKDGAALRRRIEAIRTEIEGGEGDDGGEWGDGMMKLDSILDKRSHLPEVSPAVSTASEEAKERLVKAAALRERIKKWIEGLPPE